ncbi:unnamed protein product [Amoebophrya sp. A25]|nr:unnamed protein product [Amoebophrya sp. A25]|eukprot:GSA25T00023816001.1
MTSSLSPVPKMLLLPPCIVLSVQLAGVFLLSGYFPRTNAAGDSNDAPHQAESEDKDNSKCPTSPGVLGDDPSRRCERPGRQGNLGDSFSDEHFAVAFAHLSSSRTGAGAEGYGTDESAKLDELQNSTAHYNAKQPLTSSSTTRQQQSPPKNKWRSHVRYLYPTPIEVINVTSDLEAAAIEGPAFNRRIAKEATREWRKLRDTFLPALEKVERASRAQARGLPKNFLLVQNDEVGLNDAFYYYQRAMFETGGFGSDENFLQWAETAEDSLLEQPGGTKRKVEEKAEHRKNSTWAGMEGLPEYQRLRTLIAQLALRYLQEHVGVMRNVNLLDTSSGDEERGKQLPSPESLFSIQSWFSVQPFGGWHGAHTHTGEYVCGVYYASMKTSSSSSTSSRKEREQDTTTTSTSWKKAPPSESVDHHEAEEGSGGGNLRFGDPRGASPPFGHEVLFRPLPGQIILFPSWMPHEALLSSMSSAFEFDQQDQSEVDDLRVVMAFNIGPKEGSPAPRHWYLDPVSKIVLERKPAIQNLFVEERTNETKEVEAPEDRTIFTLTGGRTTQEEHHDDHIIEVQSKAAYRAWNFDLLGGPDLFSYLTRPLTFLR